MAYKKCETIRTLRILIYYIIDLQRCQENFTIQKNKGGKLKMDELKPCECIARLWALYDRFEDKDHEICGDAAKLIDTLYSHAGTENKSTMTDERPVKGNCFVLRPDRDPAARVAIKTYALYCGNPQLSNELINWIDGLSSENDG